MEKRIESNKAAPGPFCLFRWGPHPKAEGLVITNHRLAASIKLAANLVLAVTVTLYIMFSMDLLKTLELKAALGVIAFMTRYFVVMWRAIPFYKTVYIEDYAMGPHGSHIGDEIHFEKTSTLV
ncbi:hypothetical protein ACP4OV_030204 [Aristida adscensionis]